MKNTWCVYAHISPSNKVYIGITHLENPEDRWGKCGNKYGKKTIFYKAISKYGWESFTHKILFRNCSEELAKKLEIAFIEFYKEQDRSYNMTIGGEGHNLGKESNTTKYRTEQSKKYRASHPEYDKEQYLKHWQNKKEGRAKWYYKNREEILEKMKNNKERKEKARIRAAEWRRNHPGYMKEYMKIYNAKKKLNE